MKLLHHFYSKHYISEFLNYELVTQYTREDSVPIGIRQRLLHSVY